MYVPRSMWKLPEYVERLLAEVERQSCHIKVAFDQIFHRNLLGFNFRIKEIISSDSMDISSIVLPVSKLRDASILLLMIADTVL